MPTPIRKDDGRFNGSVGDGVKNTPATPPPVPPAASQTGSAPMPLPRDAFTPPVTLSPRLTRNMNIAAGVAGEAIAAWADHLGWPQDVNDWNLNDEEDLAFTGGMLYGNRIVRNIVSADDPARTALHYANMHQDWMHPDNVGDNPAAVDDTFRRALTEHLDDDTADDTTQVSMSGDVLSAFDTYLARHEEAVQVRAQNMDWPEQSGDWYLSDDENLAFSGGVLVGMRAAITNLNRPDAARVFRSEAAWYADETRDN